MPIIAEDLLLLSYDEERPRRLLREDARWTVALVTALVGELRLLGRIRVSEGAIRVLDGALTGDPLLDAALDVLSDARYVWRPREWLNILYHRLQSVELGLAERLVKAGSIDARRGGWYVASRQWPLPPRLQVAWERQQQGHPVSADLQAVLLAHMQVPRRAALVQRMRAALLLGDACDDRMRLLACLADATGVLERAFDHETMSQIRDGVHAIASHDVLVKELRHVALARNLDGAFERADLFAETPPWARY